MWWLFVSLALGGELQVQVDSPERRLGSIGCRLFDLDSSEIFPGGDTGQQTRAHVDQNGRKVCTFTKLRPGRYAVAALLDQNQNNTLDTSRIGLPIEPWGVTNNVRPSFRAPSFDEAAIVVPSEGLVQTTVVLKL